MNYYEFKIVMMSHITNPNENILNKFWQVYYKMYKSFELSSIGLLDILVFLYKKANTLDIDELTSLATIMLNTKIDYYISSSNDSPIYLLFVGDSVKYNNTKNVNLCSEYVKELKSKKVSMEFKRKFTYDFYNILTRHKFDKKQLLNMVNIHFFLHENLENLENTALLTNAIMEYFESKLNLNFVNSCSWCYGNLVTKFEENYFDLAYKIKYVVDEKLVDKEDITKYFVLGALSKKFYDSDIDYFNDEILEGQKYFLSKGNDLIDTAESISDYIQDERYQEIKIDFILGIIKEGLLLKENKLLIKN